MLSSEQIAHYRTFGYLMLRQPVANDSTCGEPYNRGSRQMIVVGRN